MKIARWLIIAGSAVLFLSALFHGSGYFKLGAAIEKSGAELMLVHAFKAFWLMFSFHLIVLSAIFIAVSRTSQAKPLVLLCTLIPASDTVLLYHFLGVFIGTIALAIATLLFLAGGLLLPRAGAT